METLFGNSYETIGNTNSDLLLKTRGNIKAQIGNTFKDLFNEDYIKKLDYDPTKNSIPSKNGLYFYNSNLYLVMDGNLYTITLSSSK